MNVGSLRERITIQRIPKVIDPIGGETEGAPVDIDVDVPAAVESLSIAPEHLQIGQLRGAITKLIRLRYREDLTDDLRVLWRGWVLEVGLVDALPKERETRLYCAVVQS